MRALLSRSRGTVLPRPSASRWPLQFPTPLPAFGIRLAGADGRRDLSSLSSLVGAGKESAAARAKKIEHVDEALKVVQTYAVGRSDESINVSIVLNVDVKRSDERVRGNVLLPHSNGKTARVAVFARGALADEAREAGADIVGAEDLVSEIVNGRLDFDRTIAAPDVMPILAKAARQLGPKGLMPNPKRGTVTTDIADAVRLAKAGQIEIRATKQGVVYAPIGKSSFKNNILRENVIELM